MNTLKFLTGGYLGDFIWNMRSIRDLCMINGAKADIYVTENHWRRDRKKVLEELAPIVYYQDYVNSIQLIEDRPENVSLIGAYDLNEFRHSVFLWKKLWVELLSDVGKYPIQQPYSWMSYLKDNKYKNKIVISRATRDPQRINPDFPWEKVLAQYDKKDIIVAADSLKDFQAFPYRKGMEFKQINNIHEWFVLLNSAKVFIGNMSAPATIRTALDLERIHELSQIGDAYHWIGEERYSDKSTWFVETTVHNLKGI